MLTMFELSLYNLSHQHKIIESLLDPPKKQESVVLEENINMEDISF